MSSFDEMVVTAVADCVWAARDTFRHDPDDVVQVVASLELARQDLRLKGWHSKEASERARYLAAEIGVAARTVALLDAAADIYDPGWDAPDVDYGPLVTPAEVAARVMSLRQARMQSTFASAVASRHTAAGMRQLARDFLHGLGVDMDGLTEHIDPSFTVAHGEIVEDVFMLKEIDPDCATVEDVVAWIREAALSPGRDRLV
jgi:hypothetical protein